MSHRLVRKASSFFDFILTAFMFLTAVIIAFLMLSVSWDVVSRAAFGKPLAWALEFTEYGLLYITFLCTAWVLRDEGHVASDLLLVNLKPRVQFLMNAVTSILGAAICLTITWFGTVVSLGKLKSGAFQPTAIQPPDFPIFVIIPIGSFLLFIQFLRRANSNFRSWKAAREKEG